MEIKNMEQKEKPVLELYSDEFSYIEKDGKRVYTYNDREINWEQCLSFLVQLELVENQELYEDFYDELVEYVKSRVFAKHKKIGHYGKYDIFEDQNDVTVYLCKNDKGELVTVGKNYHADEFYTTHFVDWHFDEESYHEVLTYDECKKLPADEWEEG